LIATPTPTPVPATATPSPVSVEQEVLSYAQLTPEDLPGAWTLDASEIPDVSDDTESSVCDTPPFPQRDQRLARLRTELSDESLPAYVLQDFVVFPTDLVSEAMAYGREAVAACSEWTAEGTTFFVSPLDDPELGDESFAVHITFDANGVPIESDWIFVRVENYIMSVTYLTTADGDLSPAAYVAQVATARLTAAAQSVYFSDYDPEILASTAALLLTESELGEDWSTSLIEIPDDTDRYGVCDAEPFPEEFGALAEVSIEIERDPNMGPFLWHSITVLAEGDGAAAMEFIRESTSCTEWEDEGDVIAVEQIPVSELGDDAYAVIAMLDNEEFGMVQVEFLFVQTGDVISVIGYALQGEIDPAEVESYAQTAVAKLNR
jgi:hypothetical protein